MKQTTILLSLLAMSETVISQSINWGSEFGSVNVQSDGITAVTGGFTIQLGKFTSGFNPDGGNVDLWAAQWTVFDELLPGAHNAAVGYFTSELELLDNNVFAAGDRAYVWMYNNQTAVPGSEWLLYTNDATDGNAVDDWSFPAAPGNQQTVPLAWRVSNASRVVFGGLDPDRGGPDDPRQGAGYGTAPEGFNLQTHTFVPEPATALMGIMATLLIARRRRHFRPVAAAPLVALMALSSSAGAAVVNTDFAYAVADGGDALVRMNRFDGSGFQVIGVLGVPDVEALCWNLRGDTLYAADAEQFGTVNYNTGAFTAIGTGIGTGNGSLGALAFNDEDGLFADPTNGVLYATVRRENATTELDLLIQINPVTGAFVPNAFGPGLDYVPIATNTIGTTPVLYDVDDIGIDPVTGQMYGVANNAGGNDRLITINKLTGSCVSVGQLRLANNTPITDMEGYSYFNDGTFYGTTGNNSSTAGQRNRLWNIDKVTGICTLIGLFGSQSDYEGVGVLHAGYNTITGTVFGDVNRDALLNSGDDNQPGAKVRLYRDMNGDGALDGGDFLFNSAVTDGAGFYSFETASTGSFITVVDTATLPAGVFLTTSDTQTAVFAGWGKVDANNNFGFTGNAAAGDYVWNDSDSDGIQDLTEFPIAGVRVYLDQDNDGIRDATEPFETTDAFGGYMIKDLLPGTYTFTVETSTLPGGVTQTFDPDATSDHKTSITLSAAQNLLTADFGYLGNVTLGDYVWIDRDSDGVQDPSEFPLPGVRLYIDRDGDGDFDPNEPSAVTGSSGLYSFTGLIPGTYTIAVDESTLPAGAFLTGDPDVLRDGRHTVSPTAGQTIVTADFGYRLPKPATWAAWQFQNPLGGENGPNQNPEGDLYDNLIEFAFCYDPLSGLPRNPVGNRAFCLLQTGDSAFDVEIVRPGGVTGLTYTLQYAAALGVPTAWTDNDDINGIVPVVLDNGNGFQTVRWQNLESIPALNSGRGYTRIKVTLDPSAATGFTEVQGWLDHRIAAQCETYSNPFLKKDVLSGTGDAGSPEGEINVSGCVPAGTDVSDLLVSLDCPYVEIISGPLEGHRFAVDTEGGDADTIALLPDSNFNTMNFFPDLSGSAFVVREPWRFNDLFPTGTFQSGGDVNAADNILTFDNSTQSWTTCFLANLGPSGTYWVDSADTVFPPFNLNNRCLDLNEGIYVHRRGAPLTVPLTGVVRENDFRCPLTMGYNLTGGGYPLDQSYAGRGMTLAAGFNGDRDIRDADQVLFWAGDTTPGRVSYRSHYLLDAGAPYRRWVSADDNFVTALDNDLLFFADRAAFIRRTAPLPGYTVPAPWSP